MKQKIVVEIICLSVILLFMYAAFNKLFDIEKFRVQIGQSPMLTVFAHWVAWLIPVSEIATSVILMIPVWRLMGLYFAFSLMVMFTSYIIAILNFSTYIPCSCGGVLEKLGWTEHLVFNIAFIVLIFVAIVFESSSISRKSLLAPLKS